METLRHAVKSRPPLRHRQRVGLATGVVVGIVVTAILVFPGRESLHARGPMNIGHEDLSCDSCHLQAAGSIRQQLQANARYGLGMRDTPADFGLQRVDNRACLDCHDRPNDRHPVFRFNEPRFAEARGAISAHQCVACHLEHTGRRVTIGQSYCSNCHGDLQMAADPLDVSHAQLVAEQRWLTCLGCHDFHGNHERETPEVLSAALGERQIQDYFDGVTGSPYSETKLYPARKERGEREELAR